jgi:hypothetical protein
MRNFAVSFLVCLALLVTVVLSKTATAEQKAPGAAAPKAAAQAPAPAAAGRDTVPPVAAKPSTAGGQVQLIGTIKDIMEGIVDPSSDILWDSVATDITAAGVVEKRPRTDEEWAMVESAALMLAEAPNMLKMPGRKVARPGQKTQSEGPDAPELTADQIYAKINRDRPLFIKYANGLQNTAKKALTAARNKDVNGLFDVGEEIDTACENCHLEYWYPNEKKPAAAPSVRK